MTRVLDDVKLDFSDVLLVPKRSQLASRNDVDLFRTIRFKHSGATLDGTIPVIGANMDGVGTFNMYKALWQSNMITALSKHYSVDELVAFYTEVGESYNPMTAWYSMGITEDDFDKWNTVKERCHVPVVVLDVANGYSENFIDSVTYFRNENPDVTLIAGNVATPNITEQLILAGADVVKVGIGGGNACSTRIKTGIGYPQLSAALECSDAAHGLGAHIISDGGITCAGDVAKAFAGGADFTMIGSMFAGHDEGISDDTTVYVHSDGTKMVEFYGMSSIKAQEKHGGSHKHYRASEGRILKVPYKGSVIATCNDIAGGLRSCCTYVGAATLKDLPKCATFVRVNNQVSALYGIGQL